MMKPVVILDYGMGNIYSIKSALNYLGVDSVLSAEPDVILAADHLILPGVGAFRTAMNNLRDSGLDKIIHKAALEKKIPLLGICLGMQLMGLSSTEESFTQGLGLIDFSLVRFAENKGEFKIPHVGFNTVHPLPHSVLFKDLGESADVYFTHSFRMSFEKNKQVSSSCFYEETFVASFEKNNIFGTQFHPEKSQSNGLIILKNFLEWKQNA